MIHIVNKYKEPNHIYCGRGSPLGNPFPITDVNDRDRVCDMYADYFKQKVYIERNPTMIDELYYIFNEAQKGDINLGCFCSPKRCHCETIKEFVEIQLNKLNLS